MSGKLTLNKCEYFYAVKLYLPILYLGSARDLERERYVCLYTQQQSLWYYIVAAELSCPECLAKRAKKKTRVIG